MVLLQDLLYSFYFVIFSFCYYCFLWIKEICQLALFVIQIFVTMVNDSRMAEWPYLFYQYQLFGKNWNSKIWSMRRVFLLVFTTSFYQNVNVLSYFMQLQLNFWWIYQNTKGSLDGVPLSISDSVEHHIKNISLKHSMVSFDSLKLGSGSSYPFQAHVLFHKTQLSILKWPRLHWLHFFLAILWFVHVFLSSILCATLRCTTLCKRKSTISRIDRKLAPKNSPIVPPISPANSS